MSASPIAQTFLPLLESLAVSFAAEPAMVSVNTEHFGTLTRADVERLLPLAREAAQREAAPTLPESDLPEDHEGPVVPVVGMGGTVCHWSDRSPVTVVAVSKSGKAVTVRDDEARLVEGSTMSERQRYTYHPAPAALTEVFTLRNNGRWVRQGEPARRGTGLSLGHRRAYRDPSF